MYCSLRLFATVPRGLPYPAFATEDAVRLARWMVRPVLIGLTLSVLLIGLLFAAQQAAPVFGNSHVFTHQLGIGNSTRTQQERALDADVDAYLAALEATHNQNVPIALP